MSNEKTDILIIGSGFAGLVTAILLKRAGISCRIFEANKVPTDIGGSIAIFPNGMKVLKELGLNHKVIEAGHVLRRAQFKDVHGKLIVNRSMGQQELYGEPTVTVRRSIVHRLLREATVASGIEVEYDKRLLKIDNQPDSVKAIFEDNTIVEGKILIGADGINSLVRDFIINTPVTPNYSELVCFGGFVTNKNVLSKITLEDGTQNVTVGPVGFFVYSYVDNVKTVADPALFWCCYLDQKRRLTRQELNAIPDNEVIEKVLAAHEGWHSPLKELIESASLVSKANVSDVIGLDTWSKNRAIIIGDAAHGMNPISGQGACVSMEDAKLLADLIKLYKYDYEFIFKNFEEARKPRVTKISEMARKSSKMTMKHFGKIVSWFRNKAFGVLTLITPEHKANWSFVYETNDDLEKIKSLKH